MKRIIILTITITCLFLSLNAHIYHVYIKGSAEPRIIVADKQKSVSFVTDDNGTPCMRFPLYYENTTEDIPLDQIEEIKFNVPTFRVYPSEFLLPSELCILSMEAITNSPIRLTSVSSDDYKLNYPGESQYSLGIGADINENTTDSERVIEIPFTNQYDGVKQIVRVRQSNRPMWEDNWKLFGKKYNWYCLVVTSDEQDVEIPVTIDGARAISPAAEWLTPASVSTPYTCTIHVDENKGDGRSEVFYIGGRNFSVNNKLVQIEQLKPCHTLEEQLAALRDFYNATGGPDWTNNHDWLSDKPLHEWYGINRYGRSVEEQSKYRIDRFVTFYSTEMYFQNITGMLPPSFTVLMDDAKTIELGFSGMTGKFPKEIVNHPRWNEFGWDFINVSTYHGGKIDYSDGINLKAENKSQWDAVRQQWFNVHDVLGEHDYTLVINAPTSSFSGEVILAPEYVNIWLDYKDKGLGMVTSQAYPNVADAVGFNPYLSLVEPELLKDINNYEYPKDIRWFDNFASVGPVGTPAIYDREGNLIWACPRDYLMPPKYFADEAACELRKIYGDPVPHDPFTIDVYTSSDYSQDGVVIELQKATVGNGIDIVLMGDGFVDTDMDDNGRYQQLMAEAMEYLFMTEPMASLRDRFNVYAVKVVSPNDFSYFDAVHALNDDQYRIREYAEKVPGLVFDKAHTCVIYNQTSIVMSGYTRMLYEGGSLAIIDSGLTSDIIIHEVVGHGIGKLLDEYIEPGFENVVLTDEDKKIVKQWLQTNYHSLGYGMNISSSPIPEETPWAHMLADPDYSKVVSVVKGAWYYPNDLWRPTENSCMRYDYMKFNAPGRESIYKWVMSASEGPDWKYDFATFKEFDKDLKSENRTSDNQKVAKVPRKINRYDNSHSITDKSPIIHRGGKIERLNY